MDEARCILLVPGGAHQPRLLHRLVPVLSRLLVN
jgi:hypothetical protein